jgi:hypothetical protein
VTRLVVVVCAAIFVATFTIVYAGVNSIAGETWPEMEHN